MKWRVFVIFLVFLFTEEKAEAQWTEPEPFPVVLGTAVSAPWISNDNLRMYASAGNNIYVIERDSVGAPWGQWRSVAAHINDGIRVGSPCESPTGDTLYFMSWERPGGYGDYDIWYCVRTDTGWGPMTNCGPDINSEYMEWSVGISRDGSMLLVSSNYRPTNGGLDLWYSEKRPDGTWGSLVNFGPNVNSYSYDEHPSMSPDINSLYFYMVGPNMGDIWVSRRINGIWQPRQQMPPPINTISTERDPCIAADGKTLFFVRQYPQAGNTLYVSIDTTLVASGSLPEPWPGHAMQLVLQQEGSDILRLDAIGIHSVGDRDIVIYDILGREVQRTLVSFTLMDAGVRGQLRLNHLPSGTYFLIVNFAERTLSGKFNKLR